MIATKARVAKQVKTRPCASVLPARRRVLLTLLDALGGRVAALDFHKLLFLLCQEYAARVYEFVPYEYGAFSFTCYADRRRLVADGLCADDDHVWRLTDAGRAVCATLPHDMRQTMRSFSEAYAGVRGDALLNIVYRRFPYYACRSHIAARVLGADATALAAIRAATPAPAHARLFTSGYEGRSLEAFLNTLLQAGVTVLCDVRRNPLSRKYGFSKSALTQVCAVLGIRYEHVPELGIASEERRGLASSDDYTRLFARYMKTTLPGAAAMLTRIASWVLQGEAVALLCLERAPQECHRHCIARALEETYGAALRATHL